MTISKRRKMNNNIKRKSALSKGERDLINITTGKKKPKSERDEKLAREIKGIKERGGRVYIPHD